MILTHALCPLARVTGVFSITSPSLDHTSTTISLLNIASFNKVGKR